MEAKKIMKKAWIGAFGLLLSAATCSQWGGLSGDETFSRQDQCSDALGCDDGNPCTVDVCDAETTTCVFQALVDGSNVDAEPLDCKLYVCEGGVVKVSPVDEQVTCKANGLAGQCENGECVTECTTTADSVCDDHNPCTDDACDLGVGQCRSTAKANGEPSGVVEECRVQLCEDGADSWIAEPAGTSCTTCDAPPCVCDEGACVDPTCDDDATNGSETDVDCGGGVCWGCAVGQTCAVGADCLSGFCDDGTCQDCTTHADCPGQQCLSGTCVPKSDDGEECNDEDSCASGFCVDGVCCDSACDGLCEACTSALRGNGTVSGQCGPIQAGANPNLECAAQSCVAGAQSSASACDGNGACSPSLAVSCGPYVCDAQGQACLSGCSTGADCASSGDYCSASVCVPKKSDGEVSTDSAECQSGHASDGFCCNNDCSGTCMACSKEANGVSDGTCAPIPAGTNPDGECQGECTSTCDGAGACFDAVNTTCAAAWCDLATNTEYGSKLCDGAGTCGSSAAKSCIPFTCGSVACKTICSSNADCVSGALCVGNACVLPKGLQCSSDGQCQNGHCADGYCCDTACSANCRQCDLAGAEGTCSNVPAGFTDNSNSTCTSAQACDGKAACKAKAGQVCNQDADCASNICVGQVVKVCKSSTGLPCALNTDCMSNSCNGSGLCN